MSNEKVWFPPPLELNKNGSAVTSFKEQGNNPYVHQTKTQDDLLAIKNRPTTDWSATLPKNYRFAPPPPVPHKSEHMRTESYLSQDLPPHRPAPPPPVNGQIPIDLGGTVEQPQRQKIETRSRSNVGALTALFKAETAPSLHPVPQPALLSAPQSVLIPTPTTTQTQADLPPLPPRPEAPRPPETAPASEIRIRRSLSLNSISKLTAAADPSKQKPPIDLLTAPQTRSNPNIAPSNSQSVPSTQSKRLRRVGLIDDYKSKPLPAPGTTSQQTVLHRPPSLHTIDAEVSSVTIFTVSSAPIPPTSSTSPATPSSPASAKPLPRPSIPSDTPDSTAPRAPSTPVSASENSTNGTPPSDSLHCFSPPPKSPRNLNATPPTATQPPLPERRLPTAAAEIPQSPSRNALPRAPPKPAGMTPAVKPANPTAVTTTPARREPLTTPPPSTVNLPPIIIKTVAYIEANALTVEGIFRESANAGQLAELKRSFDRGVDVDITNFPDPHVIAGLLKLHFRELPQPIFPVASRREFLDSDDIDDENERIVTLKRLVRALPRDNFETLKFIFRLFSKVAANAEKNKMTPTNLAICLGPTLFRSNSAVIDIVQMLISNYEAIFEAP